MKCLNIPFLILFVIGLMISIKAQQNPIVYTNTFQYCFIWSPSPRCGSPPNDFQPIPDNPNNAYKACAGSKVKLLLRFTDFDQANCTNNNLKIIKQFSNGNYNVKFTSYDNKVLIEGNRSRIVNSVKWKELPNPYIKNETYYLFESFSV